MKIGSGKAFILGEKEGSKKIPVAKQWLLLEGRRILVEEVTIPAVTEQLETLPLGEQAAAGIEESIHASHGLNATAPPGLETRSSCRR